ncbi:hypothetical protein LBMAG42_54770 [Deltaproteobacteria bacterium]|nr:hypothetical protein LBMAG42_54770 [Deltaproteobacteria bacterium]
MFAAAGLGLPFACAAWAWMHDLGGGTFATERLAVAGILLSLSAVATFEFLNSQSALGNSRASLAALLARTDWADLVADRGSTWAERAVARTRATPTAERLPNPRECVATLQAEAETGGVLLRWFATGAVLVGLVGTLYGLGGSITAAVALLMAQSAGDSATLSQGMAAALEPLTFCFQTSLLGVVVSLVLTLARIVQDAEIDAHMAEIEELLSERMSSSLFPHWRGPAERIEAAMAGLAAAAAQMALVPQAIKNASIEVAGQVAGEVRRELAGVKDGVTAAAREGFRAAGAETLQALAAQDEPRRRQTAELAKQLAAAGAALTAAEATIRGDHDHMIAAAVKLDAVHAAITTRTTALLSRHVQEVGDLTAKERAALLKEATVQVDQMLSAQRAESTRVTAELNRQGGVVTAALAAAATSIGETAGGQLDAARVVAATTGTTVANLTAAAKASDAALRGGAAAHTEAAKSAAKAAEGATRAAAAVTAAAAGAFGTLGELKSETAATRGAIETLARRMSELASVELAAAQAAIREEVDAARLAVLALAATPPAETMLLDEVDEAPVVGAAHGEAS